MVDFYALNNFNIDVLDDTMIVQSIKLWNKIIFPTGKIL